ncbi:MAG: hypothetical protein U5J83_18450 [Bryobacterales bacterium]|nr:hypothetical protein [Bryobacterales bacterium]
MDPSATRTPPKNPWPKYLGMGCLVVIVLLLIGGSLAYYAIRSAVSTVAAEYASDEPLALPELKISAAETSALENRVRAFSEALDEGRPAEPLVLTQQELNALIQSGLSRSKASRNGLEAYVRIVGSRLEADVSIPLSQFGGDLEGRYMNGKARVSAGVVGDRLVAHLEDLKVGDHYLPDRFRERISRENILKGAYDDPEARRFLTRLESVEIGDGKLTLKPRVRPAP